MGIYLMDKSYRITTSGGAGSAIAVVGGSAAGDCTLPVAANAAKVLGITTTSQSETNRAISVRKAGVAEATAAGPIAIGDPVNIADAQGRVKAVNEASGTRVHCIGFAESPASAAGDIIQVFLSIHEFTA